MSPKETGNQPKSILANPFIWTAIIYVLMICALLLAVGLWFVVRP